MRQVFVGIFILLLASVLSFASVVIAVQVIMFSYSNVIWVIAMYMALFLCWFAAGIALKDIFKDH